jgi:hypothetical protein
MTLFQIHAILRCCNMAEFAGSSDKVSDLFRIPAVIPTILEKVLLEFP